MPSLVRVALASTPQRRPTSSEKQDRSSAYYAETFAERFRGVPKHLFEHGFDLRLVPTALELPHRWRRGRLVFVNSMSDLFHEDVPPVSDRR
jgi:protein gp37